MDWDYNPLDDGDSHNVNHLLDGALPEPDGQHYWSILGIWHVNPVDGDILLDSENLVAVTNPRCFHCQQIYTTDLHDQPCPVRPKECRRGPNRLPGAPD